MNKTFLELTEEQEKALIDLVPSRSDGYFGYAVLGQAIWQNPPRDKMFIVKFRRYDRASAMFMWLAFKVVDFLDRLQRKGE